MDESDIVTALIVLVGSILAAIPGIVAMRRQAKQDKVDKETKRSESVIDADKAAWDRTTKTIESLEKKVARLEGRIEALTKRHEIERAEWKAKLAALEEENAELKHRIEELEGR